MPGIHIVVVVLPDSISVRKVAKQSCSLLVILAQLSIAELKDVRVLRVRDELFAC